MNTVISLDKIVKAHFYYVNQFNNIFKKAKPTKPTVNGEVIDSNAMAYYHHDSPHETLLERARRLENLDEWSKVRKG